MKAKVEVVQVIEVEVDETKFDEAFLAEFRESFFSFHTIEDHVKHLAQLYARGFVDDLNPRAFIEGYGVASEMGIRFRSTGETEVSILTEVSR